MQLIDCSHFVISDEVKKDIGKSNVYCYPPCKPSMFIGKYPILLHLHQKALYLFLPWASPSSVLSITFPPLISLQLRTRSDTFYL